jgi:chitin disaccharide deacetylase
MAEECYLIVNADDLGLSPGVNDGIFAAHAGGIVTSASLMVRWPAAAAAAAWASDFPGLGLGLHVDLGEWACHGGEWRPLYEVVPLADGDAVAAEVGRQLDRFRALVGRDPDHLDSHQHVHREEPARLVMLGAASRLGVPLRHFTPGVRYCGEFYGQTADGSPLPELIAAGHLLEILAALRPGVTELACHPGYADDLETMYRGERAREVQALCDPRVRQALAAAGVRLCSFRDVPARAGG